MNRKNVIKRVNRIMDIARRMAKNSEIQTDNFIEDINFCTEGYSEPGYSSKSGMIMIGNWNNITNYDRDAKKSILISNLPDRLSNIFEKMGIDCVYYDEWTTCNDCGKAIRTNPDSYLWTASYHNFDGEISCIECILKDPLSYLNNIEGKYNFVNTIKTLDPSKYGYEKINQKDYSNDFYGNSDSPLKLSKELEGKGIYRYLFSITGVGQFNINFSLYVHTDEIYLLNDLEEEEEKE